MITVSHLSKHYPGNPAPILRDVNVSIRRGEIISIIGPSGTGKSTFLRCLNLLETPTSGQITFDGLDLLSPAADINRVRRRMGMVFQNFNLFAHLSVLENISAPQRHLLRKNRRDADARSLRLLETVGLAARADAFPGQLSGGQKQRVAIARALAMDPEVVLFDEPTSALDPTMVGEVLAVIRRLATSGMTLLIVTHEMQFARDLSTRVLYMDEGVIHEDGPPSQIFGAPLRRKTRAFVRHLKSFVRVLPCGGFDDIGFLNDLDNFALKHELDREHRDRLRLIAEEVTLNLLRPVPYDITFTLQFPDDRTSYELLWEYGGPSFNPLENGDPIARRLVNVLLRSPCHTHTAPPPLNRLQATA